MTGERGRGRDADDRRFLARQLVEPSQKAKAHRVRSGPRRAPVWLGISTTPTMGLVQSADTSEMPMNIHDRGRYSNAHNGDKVQAP